MRVSQVETMTEPRHSRTIELTDIELVVLNNALNEVCNGVGFGDSEFHTRVGVPREDARKLLAKVSSILGTMPEGPASSLQRGDRQ